MSTRDAAMLTPQDRMKAWAVAARSGDVSGPLLELEAILERAARSSGGSRHDGLEPRLPEAWNVGALDRLSLAWLIRGAQVHGWHHVVGTGIADARHTRGAPGGRAVVGLAVRVGALVTVGARRGTGFDRSYAAWLKPHEAWPEVGALTWSRPDTGVMPMPRAWRSTRKLTRPAQARLEAWTLADPLGVMSDRVTMDEGTARALALHVFAEAWDGRAP